MKTGFKAFVSLAICPGDFAVHSMRAGRVHFHGQPSKELRLTALTAKDKESLRLMILESVDQFFEVQKIAEPELSLFKKLFRRKA